MGFNSGLKGLNKLRASELKDGIPAVFSCYDLFIWPFILHYFVENIMFKLFSVFQYSTDAGSLYR